jgi:hypothetical protein
MEFDAQTISVILGGVLATKGLAMYIVNTTDTPVNEGTVKTIYKVIEKVAGIVNPKKAKQA